MPFDFMEEYKKYHKNDRKAIVGSFYGQTDEDFDAFAAWCLAFAEKRALLGCTNHLLYICRKK